MINESKSGIKKNLIFMGISVIIVQLMNFVISSLLGHRLSVETFGIVSLSQAIMAYFTLLTLFGIQTLGAKEVAKREDKEGIVGEVISLRLGIALFSIVMIFLLPKIYSKGEMFNRLILLYGLTLIPISFNLDWFFAGIYEMKHNAIFNIIKIFLPMSTIIFCVWDDTDVNFIPIGAAMGLMLASLYHISVYFKKGYRIRRIKSNTLFKMSLPFVLGSMLSTINGNSDTLIVGKLLDERMLGIYSAAYKIIFLLLGMITVLFSVAFPLLSKYKGEKLEKVVTGLIKASVIFGIPIAIGGIIYSKEILILLFGEKFQWGSLSLSILLVYFVVLFFREICAYSLNAWDMEKVYLKIVGISAVGNIITNMILIPLMGIEGAATATLMWEIYAFVSMRKFANKRVRMEYSGEIMRMLPILILFTLVIMIMKYMSIHILIVMPIAIVAYFGILFKNKKLAFLNELR